MDLAERTRLQKLLGMLGSSFDGERANAARMITAMAERKGVTIAELVFGDDTVAHATRPAPTRRTKPERSAPKRERPQVRDTLEALAEIAVAEDLEFVITAWEAQFCADVSDRHRYDYELSEKQLGVAQRIVEKARHARERGPAG